MKSLSGKLLETITSRLVTEFQPEQVILFGSHAWGEPNAGSDVDLMVIVSHSDLSEYERALRGHACLGDLAIAKDVMVKTRSEFDFFSEVRASLEYKIAKHGKVLYAGEHVRQSVYMRTIASQLFSQNCKPYVYAV